MTQTEHEKQLMIQKIEAHRTLIELETTLINAHIQRKIKPVKSMMQNVKNGIAAIGSAYSVLRPFMGSKSKKSRRWVKWLKYAPVITAGIGAVRYLRKNK